MDRMNVATKISESTIPIVISKIAISVSYLLPREHDEIPAEHDTIQRDTENFVPVVADVTQPQFFRVQRVIVHDEHCEFFRLA